MEWIALAVCVWALTRVIAPSGCDCKRQHDAERWDRRATEIEIANLRREVALLREIVLLERTTRNRSSDNGGDP